MALRYAMLLLALTLFGASFIQGRTFARFLDSQGVPSNQFTTGTMDLKLSDSDETDVDNSTATWTFASMKPGDTVNATLSVKNTGTVVANHIEIATSNSVTEAGSPPGSTGTIPMDTVLEIIVFNYDGVDKKALISDINGNGFKDLDDMEATIIDDLSLTDLNLAHTIEMTVLFNYDQSTNEHHGDSVTMVMTVTLNQDSSQ